MEREFFIVGDVNAPEGGIYRYRLTGTGAVEPVDFTALPKCNWIEYSPNRKYLYATCAVGDSSGAAAFRVRPDGGLTELNRVSAEGRAGCYVIVSPDGKFLFEANYLSGNVAVFALNPDGSIGRLLRHIQHTGDGPNKPRQEGPHTHFTQISPDGKWLIVIDLGIDAILLYPFDGANGVDESRRVRFDVTPGGSGPRHLLFDRSGKIAYLLDELGNTVQSLAYTGDGFRKLGMASTLPPAGFAGATKASAIRLSPDERFLFASNRGYDSVAVFALDGRGGMELRDLLLTGGSSPRDVNFLPGGREFAAANEFSDSVFFFDYDADSGKLTPNGRMLTVPHPLAIYWK